MSDRSTTGCTCGREPVPDNAFTAPPDSPVYIINHDPECRVHGDGTDYWRDLQEYAGRLAADLGIEAEGDAS